MDDFKDAPVSITELRAKRSRKGRDWTPRDVLVDLLRDIDNGSLNLSEVIVCYAFEKDQTSCYNFSAATHSSLHGMLGLLDLMKLKIVDDANGE